MNSKQNCSIAMLMAVNQVLNTNKKQLNDIKAMVTSMKEFNVIIGKIKVIHRLQSYHTCHRYYEQTKDDCEMIKTTVQVAAALYVYANTFDESDLTSRVMITPAGLRKMPNNSLKNVCKSIYRIALSEIDHLGKYGINKALLEKLKQEIDNFEKNIARPKNNIMTTTQMRLELKELQHKAEELLTKRLDKIMLLLEVTQPKAYKAYLDARSIKEMENSVLADEVV